MFQLRPGAYRLCAIPDSTSLSPTDGTALETRYVRTCNAATVTVAPADAAGFDIAMQRTGTFAISGQVLNEAGGLPRDAEVSVARVESFGASGMNGVVVRGGVFSARGQGFELLAKYAERVTLLHGDRREMDLRMTTIQEEPK